MPSAAAISVRSVSNLGRDGVAQEFEGRTVVGAPPRTPETIVRRAEAAVQEVHFCSGSVFVTGDKIAVSLLRYVQAISTARRSDVVTVPAMLRSGALGSVTLMVNVVSQISANSFDHHGPELEDDALVSRLDASTRELSEPFVWLGQDEDSTV